MEKHASKTRKFLFLLLTGLAFGGTLEAATLYKWTDAEGNVHYSQTPPTGQKADRMHIKDTPPEAQTDNDADEQEMAEGAGQDPAVVAARQRNCEIAKANLEIYKTSNRVQQPDGTIITLSEEMRAIRIRETQALVDANCK